MKRFLTTLLQNTDINFKLLFKNRFTKEQKSVPISSN